MQNNTLWARVALWGMLGFPALIGQADVAMAEPRLVTSGSSSNLGACLSSQSNTSTSTSTTTIQQQVFQNVPSPATSFGGSIPLPGGQLGQTTTCSISTGCPATTVQQFTLQSVQVPVSSSTSTSSSSPVAECTAAAAAAQNAALSSQNISI